MVLAGYLLAGGKSSRMGKNKALLRLGDGTVGEQIGLRIQAAANICTVVGDPATYQCLCFRVIPDHRAGCGPLAGIETALLDGKADWNLIAACDIPAVPLDLLRELCDEAWRLKEADCLIPTDARGKLQPLCGIYRARCLGPISQALDRGVRKVTDAVANLRIHRRPVLEPDVFQNVNTPQDWKRFLRHRTPN